MRSPPSEKTAAPIESEHEGRAGPKQPIAGDKSQMTVVVGDPAARSQLPIVILGHLSQQGLDHTLSPGHQDRRRRDAITACGSIHLTCRWQHSRLSYHLNLS